MSDEEAAHKVEVGRQLARRRRKLKLTQRALARLIDVTSRTVSAIERGKNAAQASRHPLWEEALHLVPGTLARAYKTGSPVELRPIPTAEKTRPAENDDLLALLTARVADMAEQVERATSDDRIDRLTKRVELVEEHLNEERRTREALERTVTELTRILHDDPAD
jgi:transcriptional regulator with XRE-family HTH domain